LVLPRLQRTVPCELGISKDMGAYEQVIVSLALHCHVARPDFDGFTSKTQQKRERLKARGALTSQIEIVQPQPVPQVLHNCDKWRRQSNDALLGQQRPQWREIWISCSWRRRAAAALREYQEVRVTISSSKRGCPHAPAQPNSDKKTRHTGRSTCTPCKPRLIAVILRPARGAAGQAWPTEELHNLHVHCIHEVQCTRVA
jgi:hypothetical protein